MSKLTGKTSSLLYRGSVTDAAVLHKVRRRNTNYQHKYGKQTKLMVTGQETKKISRCKLAVLPLIKRRRVMRCSDAVTLIAAIC